MYITFQCTFTFFYMNLKKNMQFKRNKIGLDEKLYVFSAQKKKSTSLFNPTVIHLTKKNHRPKANSG